MCVPVHAIEKHCPWCVPSAESMPPSICMRWCAASVLEPHRSLIALSAVFDRWVPLVQASTRLLSCRSSAIHCAQKTTVRASLVSLRSHHCMRRSGTRCFEYTGCTYYTSLVHCRGSGRKVVSEVRLSQSDHVALIQQRNWSEIPYHNVNSIIRLFVV